MMKEPTLSCPECGNEDVLVYEETAYKVNTGDFWCHSVKSHDSDAKTSCYKCGWTGQRNQLKESN